MKYGDAVVYVQKSSDGTVRRFNAIVLGSSLHVPVTQDRKPVAGADKEEHLDLAFPVLSLAPNGGLKTRSLEEIFRPAYDVRKMVDGAWVGFELPEPDRINGSPRDLVEQAFGEASETIARLRYDLAASNDIIEKLQGALNAKNAAAPTEADLVAEQHAAKIPFADLTDEQKAATLYPTWDGVLTSSGKTQAELDADYQKIAEAEAASTSFAKEEPTQS